MNNRSYDRLNDKISGHDHHNICHVSSAFRSIFLLRYDDAYYIYIYICSFISEFELRNIPLFSSYGYLSVLDIKVRGVGVNSTSDAGMMEFHPN